MGRPVAPRSPRASATAGAADDEAAIDGRRARGARNRDAVVAAMLELLREGVDRPGAHEIAARSGVSVRSVFRHFDDLESLYETAVEQVVAASAELYEPPSPKANTEARVRALVGQRATLFEEITPTRIAAEQLRRRSPTIGAHLARAHDFLRDQIGSYLAEDLAGGSSAERRATLDALDVALSWPTWHQLRVEQGASVPRASAAVRRTVEAVLAAHAAGDRRRP
jgi:AcrR family transcriptional regulator